MSIQDIPLNDELKSLGITRFVKEKGSRLLLTFNDEKVERVVLFDIHPKRFLKTIENFKMAANFKKIDKMNINKITIILCTQNEYRNCLLSRNTKVDSEGKAAAEDIGARYSMDTDDILQQEE